MAEIHCPNCGKINPEGKEVCDSCGFPLPSHTPSLNQETPSTSPDTTESPPDLPTNAQDTTPGEAQEDIPDGEDEGDAGWLDVLHAAEEGEEPSDLQTPSEEKEEEEKEDTDWLKRIRALDVDEEKGQEAPEGETFPTWMSEVEGEEKVEKTPTEEKQELPDWLQSEGEEAGEAEPIVSEKDEEETAPPEPAQEEEGHFPSWLEEEEEPSPAGEGPIQPFELDEDDEVIDDLFDEELPSWLTSVDMEKEEAETGDDISPGELPGWVEAMRPVVESSDTSGLAEDEEYIENYGPLAGIPSVLPAEADIDQTSVDEGSKLSFELQVSKTQKEYASLLENVISQEHKAKPKGEVTPVATQRVLRWLIAIVLIISVGASVITGEGAGNPSPGGHLEDEQGPAALYEMIDEMEARDTALIAFDYQPALAGELNATASGVVDHLLRRESYLAFISTQATGPSLAEHFMTSTQSKHEYQHGRDYINLGYIPGQSAGVLSFSIAPREIVPIAFNGANAWDSPPLKEIQTLSDFDLFLIITDDPTTARMWIEQANPYISRYKVAMIVSAQAEPLVRPYFQNSPQQISGLAAGLPGGRAYEELSGSPNLSSVFLFPLNVGIIVTILTIFIGGLANGILNLIKQRKNKERRGEF